MSKKYDPASEVQALAGSNIIRPLIEVENSVVIAVPEAVYRKTVGNSVKVIEDWLWSSMELAPFSATKMLLHPCVHLQFDAPEAAAEARRVFADNSVTIIDWPDNAIADTERYVAKCAAGQGAVVTWDSKAEREEEMDALVEAIILEAAIHMVNWTAKLKGVVVKPHPFRNAETDLLYALRDTGFGACMWHGAIVEARWAGETGQLIVKPVDRSWHCVVKMTRGQDGQPVNAELFYPPRNQIILDCLKWFDAVEKSLPL